jgi:hypothetical protein
MNSPLCTDAYKFSMAEAGWPLRTEIFYYAHRKGGPRSCNSTTVSRWLRRRSRTRTGCSGWWAPERCNDQK